MDKIVYNLVKNFSKNLKNERIASKLTQKEIAEKIGIKPQSYQAYENGVSLPTCENLLKLCLVLNVSPNYLFDFDL